MPDILQEIAAIRRPQLIMRAARGGQSDYDRRRDLRRLLGLDEAPGPRAALAALVPMEAELERARDSRGAARYDLSRHVLTLIAILAEARLLVRQARDEAAAP